MKLAKVRLSKLEVIKGEASVLKRRIDIFAWRSVVAIVSTSSTTPCPIAATSLKDSDWEV